MKIIYILKKGLHCYPPCLAQVLYLNDLGVEVEVYHGKDTDAVNSILNKRGIVHHELSSDRTNKTRLQSAVTLLKYRKELNKIIRNTPKDSLIWFGNCESIMGANSKLKGRKYVLSVLELYDKGTIYDYYLKKHIKDAEVVLCCEKHRAKIMQVYYGLTKTPYVLPNKPYELGDQINETDLSKETRGAIEQFKGKFTVLYQGIVTPDRPLDKIAQAMSIINNPNACFAVMGQASEEMKEKLLNIYPNTVFLGYIPSPQHLLVTKYADVGVANYDFHNLNNLFCAPNKIYEYAKFGIPMIVSQNLGLLETVGDAQCAECVDFNDVNCIVDGLKKIIDNKELYAQNTKKFYDNCNNKETIKRIVDQLKSKYNG